MDGSRKTVQRFDAIENACVLLPDKHGIIFSNGFHLQSGDTKVFESAFSENVKEFVQLPSSWPPRMAHGGSKQRVQPSFPGVPGITRIMRITRMSPKNVPNFY